ncbi:exo-alpha-sialidase [Cyclobacterium jeungdonense]|uniref:Exo-alpha-sialidase n=1 Tax=Cyclobacterium jeungdonense TaxID=708087 RepID=A0ABT8CA47_9BACT|nr:exo-alpha-sialidase [Cyclobacterium jeungdonense]MDN3689017.1 exo-alpha-sialidase [Cyclobacterium jeungdonense]
MKENNQKSDSRRDFLKDSLIAGVSLCTLGLPSLQASGKSERKNDLDYRLDLQVPTRLFDGDQCWVHPRAGLIPFSSEVVMTLSTLDLEGSDVFKGMYQMKSSDRGITWTQPEKSEALAPRIETINGEERPVAASDFWPKGHRKTGALLGTGHTIVYTPDWKVTHPRPRHTAYAVFNSEKGAWNTWKKLEMPDEKRFGNAGAGCVQRLDLSDGTVLLPIYFSPPGENARVAVCHCDFDGEKLSFIEMGNTLSVEDDSRGLHEPSLTFFEGKYLLTIRNDLQGYVTYSEDGLNYAPIRPWKFDDGSDLGNYNTQQHWVRHSKGLYLVYTRRGADNDHVFRHRAPLFMAKVDPEKMVVLRDTERILVPERGARLGNFGVTEVSESETWVTVSEWMQPKGVEKYGSDGSVYLAKIHWNEPNELFEG